MSLSSLRAGLVVVALATMTACGPQPQQFIVNADGESGCVLEGPEAVPPGVHDVLVTPAGQGVIAVTIFDSRDLDRELLEVSAQDQVGFARGSHDFAAGKYVVVCSYNQSSHAVGVITVNP